MGRDESRTWSVRVEEIRRLMDLRNLSKSALAGRAGVDVRTIRNMLQKKNDPTEETLIQVARALGVQRRMLVQDEQGDTKPQYEEGGVSVKTTVDLLIQTSEDLTPQELQKRLETALQKAGHKRLDVADIIRIIKVSKNDEV